MASIHDIARHTGLSAATISRYLNKRPYVSKEAQLTIELAMEQLGYHPNASARSLRSGKTGRVVVVVNRVNHPFFATLLSGIGEVAQKEGFDILIQQTAAANWSPTLLEEQVAARSMDGIIVTAEDTDHQLAGLLGTVPIVACDQALFDSPCPQVYIDHFQSALDGLEHLAERGATSIVAVYADESMQPCASTRYHRLAYEEFSRRPAAPHMVEVAVTTDTAVAGMKLLDQLEAMTPRPDAVFAASDEIAMGLLAAAHRAGIRVPEDLKILGFDDGPIAEAMGLSSIRQPIRKMGRRTMQILTQLINSGTQKRSRRSTQLPYEVVVRDTT